MKEIIQLLINNLNGADSMPTDLEYQNTGFNIAQTCVIPDVELISQNNEIVAFCLKTNSEVEDQEFQKKIGEGIPYYSINLNSQNQLFFNDDNGDKIEGDVKEFTKRLKKSFPKLKLDSEILIESLEEEINSKKSTIIDLEKNLNERTSTIEYNYKELKQKDDSLSQLKNYILEQIIHNFNGSRFKNKIKKSAINFFNPKSERNTSEVYFGRNAEDKYNKTLFIKNSETKRYICNYKNEWYLKIDCYTYFSDDGFSMVTDTKFAKYNSLSNEFEAISEATKIDFQVWYKIE
jgi:hypothetical protein